MTTLNYHGRTPTFPNEARAIECQYHHRSRQLHLSAAETTVRASFIECPETEYLVHFTQRYRSSGSSLIGQPKEKSTSADDRVLDLIPKVCSAVLDTIKKEYGTKFKDLCAQYHGVTLTALTEDWLSMDLA
ncbi:hypothetical protein FOZ62_025367 [Perkinsus olseni]|uniref:Uncharacterized protein n=1 Tax=Perkinsus olseni TaxID=32597 RepID=A0A7J6QJP5_PEROL|nr:hypothetical protein FOZ62_025367 [Perkinsus olseni]